MFLLVLETFSQTMDIKKDRPKYLLDIHALSIYSIHDEDIHDPWSEGILAMPKAKALVL